MGDLLTYRPSAECFRYGGKPFPGYPHVGEVRGTFPSPEGLDGRVRDPLFGRGRGSTNSEAVACVKLFPMAGVTADPIPPKIRSGPDQIC